MTWAVVPVKKLENSKSRLGDIFPLDLRMRLSVAMLQDVLGSLQDAAAIEGITVVTPDRRLSSMMVALSPGVEFILETGKSSLNGGLRQAASVLQSQNRDRMFIIPGDVPLLTAEEIDRLVQFSEGGKVVIVPDKNLKGTNGLLLTPPQVMVPFFGPDSLRRHVNEASMRRIPFVVAQSRSLGFDLDTPDDLASFLDVGKGTRTYHEIVGHLVHCPCLANVHSGLLYKVGMRYGT